MAAISIPVLSQTPLTLFNLHGVTALLEGCLHV